MEIPRKYYRQIKSQKIKEYSFFIPLMKEKIERERRNYFRFQKNSFCLWLESLTDDLFRLPFLMSDPLPSPAIFGQTLTV